MELYEQLLNEEYVKNIYTSIENNPRIPISHGMHHILNVVKYCKKLIELFSLDEVEKETLLVSAVMHDVAQVFLQANHAKNGAFIVKEMLENNETIDPSYIKSVIDIERVCNIIKCHGGKKEEEYEDKIAALLILADKLDITKDRIRKEYIKYDFLSFMACVEAVKLELKNNCLRIIIITDKETKFEKLNEKHGLDKHKKVFDKFAKRFNIDYTVETMTR